MNSFGNLWDILVVFLIPFGGGIPAGVLLAKSKGVHWIITTVLYFISDLILAISFEPMIRLFIFLGKRNSLIAKMGSILKLSTQRTIQHFGSTNGIFALVMIAFGVDPMTGRAAAMSAGHGFISGWMIAITGDMFYFGVLMISTLWLNEFLGDGTATIIVILIFMIVLPKLIEKMRAKFGKR